MEISDRSLKRAGLAYGPWGTLPRHADWAAFRLEQQRRGGRLLALSRHGSRPYTELTYQPDDWLLFGRETSGLPSEVVADADACLAIPMPGSVDHGGGVRSLNLATAAGVGLFEALRQLQGASDS